VALSRSFKVSLLLSVLIHAGVFAALDRESVSQKILAEPKPLLAKRAEPKVVRFELIDTPASAETSEPPKKTDLVSDKNTRAQDRFQGEKKLKDSPHMEGKHEDSKDTRPKMVAAKPPTPPKPERIVKTATPRDSSGEGAARRAPANDKKEPSKPPVLPENEPPKLSVVREKEPSKPKEAIRVAPEPENKEIIRLAKKAPVLAEPTAPSPAMTPPRIMSSASARNTGADAQIAGELSFAATRHFFGEYLLKMKQAVEAEWISRLVSQYSGIVRSRTVVDFKIQPDGRVTDVDASSTEGDPYFALICISSIRDAQPFEEIPYGDIPGLPEEFKGKPLSIRFTFRYN